MKCSVQMKQGLYETLAGYCQSDILPMHMPGHKRSHKFQMKNPYELDVTEVAGLDNLHQPEGVIRELMDQIAKEYRSEASFLLVNGSTCGILAAITACCRRGDRILVARNCHKAVYNAIRLLELQPVYVYPSFEGGEMDTLGIAGIILPEDVEGALEGYTDISCAVITSPTYEGILSPVSAIADVVHKRKIPLIVDEAHGAHFHWHETFPDTALTEGADIVIESLHKTLPAFTQTGVLHARFGLVKKEFLTWSLQTYQSSSPSYLLMAGAERCFSYLLGEGKEEMQRYVADLEWFRQEMKALRALRLFESRWKEPSKLVIATDQVSIQGRELADRLREAYRIETEMSCGDYVIAMTSVADDRNNFERLASALWEIDRELAGGSDRQAFGNVESTAGKKSFCYGWQRPEPGMYSYEAAYLEKRRVPLHKAVGELAAEPVYPYPPGVPLLVEGEKISKEMVELLEMAACQQISVHGVTDGFINVLVTE